MRKVPRFEDEPTVEELLDDIISRSGITGLPKANKLTKEIEGIMELPVSEMQYLVVEMVTKGATRDAKPFVGMFHGVRVRTCEMQLLTFVILSDDTEKRDALTAYSLEDYNVLSVKMEYGETKELTVFRNTEEDQKEALAFLIKVLEKMKSDKKMMDNDEEIIARSAYKGVPEELSLKKKPAGNPANNGRPTTYTAPPYTHHSGYPAYSNDEWEKKRKLEEEEKKRRDELRKTPFLLKRTSELPAKAILGEIKRKVLALAAGEYKPAIPEFEVDSKTPATSTVDAEDASYLGQFGCGLE